MRVNLLKFVLLVWHKNRTYFTWFSPTWSCSASSPWYPKKKRKEWPVLERAGEGLHFPFLATQQGSLGSWAIILLRLPGKVSLEPQCAFLWSWLSLCCLEPWLMMFMVCPCSLFTSLSVTAVEATRGERVYVWRLGVTITACFFFSTTLRNRIFLPLDMGWEQLTRALRLECLKSSPGVTQG